MSFLLPTNFWRVGATLIFWCMRKAVGHQPIASATRFQRIEKGMGHAVNMATTAAGLVGTAKTLWHAGSAAARIAGPMMAALAPVGI